MDRRFLVALTLGMAPCAVAQGGGRPSTDLHGDPLPAGAVARVGTLRYQHDLPGNCTALACSPDGRYVASGLSSSRTEKGRWYLWDRDGRCRFQAETSQRPQSMLFNAAATRLAILCGGDSDTGSQTIDVWDPDRLKKVSTIQLPWRTILAVMFAPDQETVVAVEYSAGQIILRDVPSKQVRRAWKSENVTRAALSPDGRYLTAWDGGGSARLWDTTNGKPLPALKVGWWTAAAPFLLAHPHQETCFLLRLDGERLHILDGATGKGLHTPEGQYTAAAFAPDGKSFVAAARHGAIRHWDAATGKEVRFPKRPEGEVGHLSLSPGGRYAAVNYPQLLRVIETASGTVVREARVDGYGAHAFSASGALAYLADRRLFFAPAADAAPRELDRPAHHQTYGVDFAPDGRTVYVTLIDSRQRWDVASGKSLGVEPRGRFSETAGGGRDETSVIRLADGRSLAAHYYEPNVRLMDASGRELLRWEWKREFYGNRRCGLTPLIGAVEPLPHGQMAVIVPRGARAALLPVDNVTNPSNLLRLIDLTTGGVRHEFDPRQNDDSIRTDLSPDGRFLASAGWDGNVLIWDLYSEPPGPKLSPETCWADLAAPEATKVHRAICALVNQPEAALKLLRDKVRPAKQTLDRNLLERLVADLDHKSYRTRQQAFEQLRKLHDLAVPALRQAERRAGSLELQRRVTELLRLAAEKTPEQILALRALEVLEMMRRPEAAELLVALAQGEAELFLTREAAAALRRLTR